MFHSHLTDLFCVCEERNIARYADDTAPYLCATDTQRVISELLIISSKLFRNPIQDGCKKPLPYQFFPCIFYKVRVSPQTFFAFSFNTFATLV